MIIETHEQSVSGSDRAAVLSRRRPRPILTIFCCGYLLAILATWMFLREEADRWWPATLLMVCPRWTFAVPAAILWIWVICVRRWRSGVVLTAATAALLGLLVGVRVSFPAGSDERGDLRLLSCNIHRDHVSPEQLGAFISSTHPDVVLLQDWSSGRHGSLFPGTGWDVRREGQLLIASRVPIARITPVDLGGGPGSVNERSAAACYDVKTPGGNVRLINVHLASPHSGLLAVLEDRGRELADNADRRWRESAALRDFVGSAADPVILAGDFNTTDDSPIFREHWSEFADAFSDRGLGIGYTYLNRHTQLRIDHILVGPGWQAVRCWVGPGVGSPHRPLVADLRVR